MGAARSDIDRCFVSFTQARNWPARRRAPEPASGPALAELIADVEGQLREVQVLDRFDAAHEAQAREQVDRLAAALLRMPVAQISEALAEFDRRFFERPGAARERALELDYADRKRALDAAGDVAQRLALLRSAAADYGTASAPPDMAGSERIRALRGGEPQEGWYWGLCEHATRLDRSLAELAPAAEAPGVPFSFGSVPTPELVEVVAFVVPVAASAVIDRLIDAAAGWLRRRSPQREPRRVVQIYGPRGTLLREVEVVADGERRELMID